MQVLHDHMHAGLEVVLLSGVPLVEKRDGLAFEDRLVETEDAKLHGNNDFAIVEDGTEECVP